jgi:hypothetical protein
MDAGEYCPVRSPNGPRQVLKRSLPCGTGTARLIGASPCRRQSGPARRPHMGSSGGARPRRGYRAIRRWVTRMRWMLRLLSRGELSGNGNGSGRSELPSVCYYLD